MKLRVRSTLRTATLLLLGLTALALPARADTSLFMGVSNGAPVPAFGVAWGIWHAPVGFEVELAKSPGHSRSGHTGTASFGVNLLVDTPLTIGPARLYASGGLGLFEKWNRAGAEIGGPAKNVGGGARIALGPGVLLRIDYKAFFVESGNGDYRPGTAHRIATGVSFVF